MRPIGSADELERRRIRAVELMKSGESHVKIAAILGVDTTSLYRWRKMSAKPGGLKSIPHPGAPRQLNDTQLQELEYLLGQGAKAHGWPNELWTSKRIAEVIRKQFGVDYHEGHVRRIVRKLLHWSSQKPERRARERDEDEIERWKRKDFPRIKKRSAGQGSHAGLPRRIRVHAQSHGPADLCAAR